MDIDSRCGSRSVKTLPPGCRPREKLRLFGSESLSDRELLALILGSASRRRSVMELSADLLADGRGLGALADLGVGDLSRRPGLGEAGAGRLAAALEVGRRLARSSSSSRPVLDTAQAVADRLRAQLVTERRECVLVLLLDVRHRLLAERTVSVGTLVSAIIHPREVFRPAISVAAAAIILVHNHPSGDPTPSVEDHQVTARVREAGQLLGIPLLDHVIVAAEGHRSFREEGWMND